MSMGISTPGYMSQIEQTSVTSVTRQNEFNRTELTNIATKSDAWGKVIPYGWGRHRVAGALIWASDFYATVSGFDEVTETTDIYTQTDNQVGYADYDAGEWMVHKPVILLPPDPGDPTKTSTWTSPGGSQVTTSRTKSSSIDLCYSFGKEGDKRRRRFVDKIRINDTLAYDRSTGFIAPGLGFTVRMGWAEKILPLMANFEDGIYWYKGQDLILFDKFPTGNYGDAIPNSVDVEFGCCGSAPVGPCSFYLDVNAYGETAPLYYGKNDLSFHEYRPGDLLIYYNRTKIGENNIVDNSFSILESQNQGSYSYRVGAKILTASEATSIMQNAKQLSDAASLLHLQCWSTHNDLPLLEGGITQARWTFTPAGQPYQADIAQKIGQGLCIAYETRPFESGLQGSAWDASTFCQIGDPIGLAAGQIAPDGGWMVFSALLKDPCSIQVG